MPGTSPRQRLEWTPAAVTRDGALAEARSAILKKWSRQPDGQLDALDGSFVLMSCGGVQTGELKEIARELADEFPGLTYVLMVGDSAVDGIERLEPELPTCADDAAHHFDVVLAEMMLVI